MILVLPLMIALMKLCVSVDGQNKVEPMIGCDSDDCPVKWYHFVCVNLTANTVPKEKWFCPRCKYRLTEDETSLV